MSSSWRALWLPLVLVAMTVGPDEVRSRAQATEPAATDSVRALRRVRPLVPVRFDTSRPGGVRIRSVRDRRPRILHLPAPGTADTTRSPVGVPLPVVYPSSPGIDLTGIESRLRDYLDLRLREMEARHNAALAALTATSPARRDTLYIPRPVARPETVYVATPAAARPSQRDTTYVFRTVTDTRQTETVQRDVAAGAGLVVGAIARAESARPDTVLVPVAPDTVRIAPPTDERSLPPAPVIEFVERAVLDTGLLRTVNVVFESNQATLLPASMPVLNSLGRVLVRHPDIRLEIGGHTDSVGRADYNLSLSQARADSVRAYLLTTFPISPARLATRGYGESVPVASNDTPTGRTLNRRVEFAVIRADTTRH